MCISQMHFSCMPNSLERSEQFILQVQMEKAFEHYFVSIVLYCILKKHQLFRQRKLYTLIKNDMCFVQKQPFIQNYIVSRLKIATNSNPAYTQGNKNTVGIVSNDYLCENITRNVITLTITNFYVFSMLLGRSFFYSPKNEKNVAQKNQKGKKTDF